MDIDWVQILTYVAGFLAIAGTGVFFRMILSRSDEVVGEFRSRLEVHEPDGTMTYRFEPIIPSDDLRVSREVLEELRRARADRRQGDERSYKILAEYSAQGLSQSQTSFRVSLAAAGLGFAVILLGVIVGLFSEDAMSNGALLTIVSGTIVEAVSVLFFTMSARSKKTMVDFFDKLRDDRKLEEALTLVKGVPDTVMASRLQVLQLCSSPKLPICLSFISRPWANHQKSESR